MAKEITLSQLNALKARNCDKGKHRFRTNKFGVTWCVICGSLSTKIADELQEDDKIIIRGAKLADVLQEGDMIIKVIRL